MADPVSKKTYFQRYLSLQMILRLQVSTSLHLIVIRALPIKSDWALRDRRCDKQVLIQYFFRS
jgi:hypothetical protein